MIVENICCQGSVLCYEFYFRSKGGERQPTTETTLRHIPIKNDKRKTAKAL
jgi:hypothetical protein